MIALDAQVLAASSSPGILEACEQIQQVGSCRRNALQPMRTNFADLLLLQNAVTEFAKTRSVDELEMLVKIMAKLDGGGLDEFKRRKFLDQKLRSVHNEIESCVAQGNQELLRRVLCMHLRMQLPSEQEKRKHKTKAKQKKKNSVDIEDTSQPISRGPSKRARSRAPARAYWCELCNCGCDKQKAWLKHEAGKQHCTNLERASSAWRAYEAHVHGSNLEGGTLGCTQAHIQSAWDIDELSHFPMRSSCIDKHTVLSELEPRLRGRLWRYLFEVDVGSQPVNQNRVGLLGVSASVQGAVGICRRGTDLASVIFSVERQCPQFLRVKELFEVTEAYKLVCKVIEKRAAPFDACSTTSTTSTSSSSGSASTTSAPRLAAALPPAPATDVTTSIFDLACGNGLLGVMLAYRYPHKQVVCVDIKRQPSFEAFHSAFAFAVARADEGASEGAGESGPPHLANLSFLTASVNDVPVREHRVLGRSSCVVALHGCNEVNSSSIALAQANRCKWAVVPCCIPHALYLPPSCPVSLDDNEVRYPFLCGAMASRYAATTVGRMSRLITDRYIFLAGEG